MSRSPDQQPSAINDSSEQATLTISRGSGFADFLRAYRIVLDDQVVGKIKRGETVSLPVEPGTHHLHLTIDWCRSNEIRFTVVAGDVVRFEVASVLKGWRILLAQYYTSAKADEYLTLRWQHET